MSDEVKRQGRRWRLKRSLVAGLPTKIPSKRGYAYLEITLMNFEYWSAVNYFAIIIGH
jgi:hypothetical protein